MGHISVLVQAETSPRWIHAASIETGTAQALFNGQRMEKWESSLQINFQPNSGEDAKYIGGSRLRGRKLDSGRNIHELLVNKGVT